MISYTSAVSPGPRYIDSGDEFVRYKKPNKRDNANNYFWNVAHQNIPWGPKRALNDF